MLLMSVWIPSC